MKLSPRRAETLSLIAFILQIVFFLLAHLVAYKSNSTAVRIEAWHFLGGILVWFVLLIQFRQRRLATEEKADAEEFLRLRSEGKDTSVFESAAADSTLRLAQRRLDWLEKYLVPIFSVLTAIYLVSIGVWNYLVLKALPESALAGRETILGSSAYLVGFALISFLFARYAVGMSRQDEWRPLRAGGSYLIGNALACLALAIILVVADSGYPLSERITSYVLVAAMVAIGVEMLLNLVFDVYRPRIKGQYHRAAFESRLLGLFSEPGGVLSTATHAIDYQFGFKVSETWFFKLLERTVVLLVAVQVLVLWLMSSVAIVDSGHVGVVERWGRPLNVNVPLASGLHWKLPWPMDRVHQFPTEMIKTLEIGYKSHEKNEKKLDFTPILWTKAHFEQEYPYMVAVAESSEIIGTQSQDDSGLSAAVRNDFDLLAVGLTVHYRISDIEKYGYGRERCYRNPDELLEAICDREVLQFTARSDMDTLLGPGRYETTAILHRAIENEVAKYQMGVEIIFVGLGSVHPPIEVAPSFETVVAALQERQATVLEAKGVEKAILSQARGEAFVLEAAAEAAAFEREVLTQADAFRFAQQCQAFEEGKEIYLWREYLSVLDEFLPGMRKYVFASKNVKGWVYQLDLTESQQPDLFEGLGLPEPDQEN
jgi:membrane protease subunit HflK